MYLLGIYLCALRSPFLRRLHLGERLKTTAPAARVAATRTAAKSFGGWGRSIKNLSIGKVGHFYPPWNWQQKHLKIDSWNITLPETNSSPMKIPSFLGFIPSKWWSIFRGDLLVYRSVVSFWDDKFSGANLLLVSGSLLPTFFKEAKLMIVDVWENFWRIYALFGYIFHETTNWNRFFLSI